MLSSVVLRDLVARSLQIQSVRADTREVRPRRPEPLKIAIHPVRLSLSVQARAYVEYRMFSATSRFGSACARSSIRLEERDPTSRGARYRCEVVLDLTPAERIRVRATGDGLYGAIDAAAERLARGVERRLRAQTLAPSRGSYEKSRRH